MKPSLVKLQKIFKLEAERGYDNRAVVGGLDRILDSWEVEARADGLPEEAIQAVGARLRDYPHLSESSRAEALDGLWRRMQKEFGGLPPLPTPSPVQKEETRAGVKEAAPEVKPAPTHDEGAPAAIFPVEERTAERQPATPEPSVPPEEEPAALDASITILPTVGPRHAQTLGHLGLSTLRDMLYYFPRRYDDYTQLKPINRLWYGEEVTVIGSVQSIAIRNIRNGRHQVVEALVSDGTGVLRVTWFNQPWVAKRLRSGEQIALSGKIDQYLGRLVLNNPEWEPLEQQQLSTNRIVPVYSLAGQITQRWIRRLMNQVITHWAPRVRDPLPEGLRRSANLIDLSTALLQAHFPDSWERLKAARHRLAFDEIFMMQLGVLQQKHAWQERTAWVFDIHEDWLAAQIKLLPFPLTGAQTRAIEDIRGDLATGRPMNRLLQGDVGSGKTAVAAMAIAMVTIDKAQAAYMAPTSILAEQHYRNLLSLLSGEAGETPPPLKPEEIRLMLGATPEPEKAVIRQGLADGTIKLVIGTHALIEDPVTFSELELVIVDEQHRFGVEQRAALRSKGTNPHLLVMTATPIPRSLALTVYGDLDISVMDEMPPGRQQVSTFVITPLERERAYRLIRSQVQEGHQAFIIYPLVEENERNEGMAAVEEQGRLQSEVFANLKLGLLHGRLKPDEKDEVMAKFRAGELEILVATSVVEVGVDVPNATVMLIEGANRFGLAQLHQFRGRVGRGGDKAYCLLIPDTSDAIENERLQVMTQTNDGFLLAEKDLEQRGPGEFLGTRQSGYATQLQLASLMDVALIEKARRFAQDLFAQDPALSLPEHQTMAVTLRRFWGGGKGDIS